MSRARYNEEAYRQMYPEECFEMLDQSVVEKRWKCVEEWWRRDESSGGEARVGWKCEKCGRVYFVRVLEFEDESKNVEEAARDSNGTFFTAKTSLL